MTTVARLRAAGDGRVALVTSDGTFRGRVEQTTLGDAALMVVLELASGGTVVVPLASVVDVVEET